jgi:hypothetical protein
MGEKINKAKVRLKKIYEDGEKYELKLLKELENELRHEKNTLTAEQQKEVMQMGYKMADKMELDKLKLKYEKALEDNSGIKNKKIEELIKNLEKKILK